MKKIPHLQILIAYRNRPIPNVERCLQSLANQTFKDFEVLFLNEGSEIALTEALEKLVNRFPFCSYFHQASQGMFWNKSKALNYLIAISESKFIIVMDVDLMVSPIFLEKITQQLEENQVINYHFYYLPAHFKKHESIFELPNYESIFKRSAETATGNILIEKKELEKIGGYDTFYRVWGLEDSDLTCRLEKNGLKLLHWEDKEALVFHQWHPPVSQNLPKGWQTTIENHFQTKKTKHPKENHLSKNILLNQANRPTLKLLENKNWQSEKQFSFDFPKENAFNSFTKRFLDLAKGDYFFVKQNFEPIQLQKGSRLGNWLLMFNHFFQKTGFSYRLTDIRTHETEWIQAQEVKDFLFYFVLQFENEIMDYYFEMGKEEILWIVFK